MNKYYMETSIGLAACICDKPLDVLAPGYWHKADGALIEQIGYITANGKARWHVMDVETCLYLSDEVKAGRL